jgi:ribosome maturation factor RimP
MIFSLAFPKDSARLNRKAFDQLCQVCEVVYHKILESDTKLQKSAMGEVATPGIKRPVQRLKPISLF